MAQGQGIQISKNISSLVKGWVHSSNTTQNVKLPSSPLISIRPQRLGLGAETLDSTVRKKKEERLILFKKIQKRIKKEQNEPEPDELRLMKNGRTGTSPNNDSEDEGCSRTNIINSATSRKRQKLEALKNRRLNRKRNKNKKRALIKTITTCTEDMCMDQGAGGGEIINNDILKKPVFVETNGQDMLSRRPQRGVGLNELLTADKCKNIGKDASKNERKNSKMCI